MARGAARPLRVAFLTLAHEGGASPRHRVYQYVPALERAGIRCTVLPAVPAWATRHLYATGGRAANAAYQAVEVARRLTQLCRARRFDVVVVQKALLTVGIRRLDRLARAAARALVVDIDDAVYLGPAHDLPPFLRSLEDDGQPARLLARADAVVAGSEALAAEVRPLKAKVWVLPTSVDTERVAPASRGPERAVAVVGWIGSHSTAPFLDLVAPTLRRLAASAPFVLRVVGGPAPDMPGVAVEARPWVPDREVAELQGFDVGIMPLPDTPWARGKCGLKAIQYMAVGIPAVCSPVGAAPEIVRHGREGFLATSPEEWERALGALLADPALRARIGAAGRRRAEERYSVRANAPRLAAILEAAARAPAAAAALRRAS